MSASKRNSKLQEVFKYSEADLLMNQQGQVSEDQKLILKSYRQGRMLALIANGVMLVLLALGFVGVEIWMQVNPVGDEIRLVTPIALGVVALLIALSSVNLFFSSRDILTGKVSHKQGSAKLDRRDLQENRFGSSEWGYWVKIDRKEFSLTGAEQYEALQEGAAYRIFYIKGYPLDMQLSVEAI